MNDASEKIILKGIGASPGAIEGIARICLETSEASEKFQAGDILVTSMTDPNWVRYMITAKAVITNSGGLLCHAAIVARELGIPCVVGTQNATEILQDGMRIKVDGLSGLVVEEA